MKGLAEIERAFVEMALAPSLPASLEGTRIALYRRLIHNNLDEALSSMACRTQRRMGQRFFDEAHRCYAEAPPRTHYLRDVGRDLLDFAGRTWPARPDIEPYLLDLLRHEICEIEVGAAADDEPRPLGPLSLDAPLCFIAAARVVRHAHAVHDLDEDDDQTLPARRDVALLLYRDSAHALRTLELSPAAAAILERLVDGATPLGLAITQGAASLGLPVDQPLLEGTSALLADLAERGVLLGGVPASPDDP